MIEDGRKRTEVKADGVRWRVAPEWRSLLFGPHGLRLQEWLHGGQAHVVKHGPHRTVYRVALPDFIFYLKHYRLSGLRAWLRQLVRPPKARTEFERALAVANRAVPTIVPVALGEGCARPGPSDSFLITRALDTAESVAQFIEHTLPRLDGQQRARLSQRLAVGLGAFVAQLHASGVVHRDFHPANLLLLFDDADRPHIHLVDLDSVRLRAPLSGRARRENLVILNRWSMLRVSRSDRLRFWFAYCRAHACLRGHEVRDWARKLERASLDSNFRFWQNRDRRCLTSNRYYRRCRSRAVAGYAVGDLDSHALEHLLMDPDAPFRDSQRRLLKDSPSSTVVELELLVNGVPRRVIYKRFRVKSWTDPWRALLRRTPALRSWIYGHGLRERLLPTARPLAVFHRRGGFLSYEGYLLTEKIENALDLHAYGERLATLPGGQRQGLLRGRIEQIAGLLRTLHARRLSHRDLKAANILVTDQQAWFIDLVGVAPCRQLTLGQRLKNLARLHASFHDHAMLTRTDKLRFLRTYQEWGIFGRVGWKECWRALEKATRAKVARNARNHRPLA